MMYVKKLSEFKFFEIQFTRQYAEKFPCEFSFKIRGKDKDHSGIYFIFGIYKLFWFEMAIYDCRHKESY